MAVFGVGSIDLSMKVDDADGNKVALTANVYTLEGLQNADGSLRKLSISQLVMAICLSRATELEAKIVGKMESIAGTSSQLEALTAIDAVLVSQKASDAYKTDLKLEKSVTVNGVTTDSVDDALAALGITATTSMKYSDVVTAVESKMDSLNSLSQTTLIDIQSLTSKRDDTYNLVSNVLKSLNTVLIGNVNNF